MADENKPAFYPRVGRTIAKNFRSAQPPAFIEDPRAMDLPQFGDVDLSVPSKENLEMARRIAERDAQLKRQQQADRSPLEKLAGGIQAGRFMGSALTQAVNSLPTRIFKGDEAADKFIQDRIYKPEQPLAYEYAQDIGDFLEKLETEYKIPPVLPEAVALQYLTGPATAQAARAAGRGAEQVGRKIESAMEPVVKGAFERGGLPREMVMAMGANTQSNVIKPKGGNWIGGDVEKALDPLITKGIIANQEIPYGPEFDTAIVQRIADLKETASMPGYTGGAGRVAKMLEDDLQDAVSTRNRVKDAAINKWVQSNLTNYVKKDMGTPEDPVRKLAEQDISHLPQDLQNIEMTWTPEELAKTRKRFGFPEEETATNPTAKMWEQMADEMISPSRATEFGEKARQQNPWLEKLNPYDTVYETMRGLPQALKFDHIVDVLREDIASGRIRPEQLNKVSMEQAVRRTYEYDQEMARKMAEAQAKVTEGMPIHKDYGDKGFKWIELATPEVATELPSTHIVEPYQSNGVLGQLYRVINPTTGMRGEGFATPERAIKEFNKSHAEEKLADALKYEGETMGHCVGGYCPDVLGGRSRIFSLRDAKGEPHVTIETAPQNHLDYNSWFNKQPEEIQNRIAQRRKEDKNHYEYEGPEYLAAREALPPKIKQIKGKQNAKPKDPYLPFVQDFVKGGNWSDIGDFKNTGLIREGGQIMTPAEHADWLLKELGADTYNELGLGAKIPPAAGMKRGGKVSISNNPDTMMMELGNQKMKNGVPAYGAGKAVTKQALKAAKPEVMKASEALGKIEGRPLKITQADRTKVGGGYLGGPGFSGLQLTEPEYRAAEAAWAVQNAGTAKTILGGEGDNAVYAAMLGTPTQHQSNQMVFDKLLGDFKKAAKRGELTPELRDLINMRLAAAVDKKGNPVFPADVDIMDKKFRDIADTFSRRSIAGHLMGGVQVGGKKGQIIDYDKIIRSTTDPALIDQPTGALGNRLFTLSGGIVQRPDLHPAFPTILQGEDLGVMFTPVERDIVMKDFVEKTMREKGRKPGYMDYTRGNPPTQLITEDILTELQKLGLKKGGAVKQPAAYIDGNEFVLAAQKYGIKDSMNNLNKIVDLVNKGLSVDDAARQVADTGMHKAAGGAISGDDLILEERPL